MSSDERRREYLEGRVRRVKCMAQMDSLSYSLHQHTQHSSSTLVMPSTLPRCIVECTVPMIFSAEETINIGREAGTPVTSDYDATAASSPARSTGCRFI